MLYRRTPFAHFKNKLKKWQAITDPSVEIPFSELHNKAAVHAMKVKGGGGGGGGTYNSLAIVVETFSAFSSLLHMLYIMAIDAHSRFLTSYVHVEICAKAI